MQAGLGFNRAMASEPATPPAEQILDPDLVICDPHHHLWHHGASRYLLQELVDDIGKGHRIESTVFVECAAFYRATGTDQQKFIGETEFVAGQAAMADSGRYGATRVAAAIVGRADLTQASTLDEALAQHIDVANGRFRGIRHCGGWDASPDVGNSHTNPPQNLYGRPDFRAGYAKLKDHGLIFEAWQFHPQLDEVTALARAFPDIPLMLDHVGGPLGIGPYAGRREEVFAKWAADIRELADCPNVWVKLGGLGMPICGFGYDKAETPVSSEILAAAWKPYVETCIEAFGVDRAMFESNFPVDKASCSYSTLWNAFKRLASGASASEKAKLFRDNAMAFYRVQL
jgi:predicted TIM-barrel fold metal-dependent hydrolase